MSYGDDDVAIVRCSRGGYYKTRWVSLVSFKAVRLGPYRLQRCPVHRRWELASIVPESELISAVINESENYPASRLL